MAHSKFSLNGNSFNKYAPFYPLCWIGDRFVSRDITTGNRALSEYFPDEFMDKWVGKSMMIFSGGKDYYDDQDPKACQTFIDHIPDQNQRNLTKNIVFEKATHAWDQNSARFFAKSACKGKGCMNSNIPDPDAKERGKQELLKFLQSE